MIKITFISPYKELEDKVHKCLEEVTDEGVVFEVIHISGTQEALLRECSSDIIVARGITYLALKKHRKNVSVIEIAVTGYDIITALNDCKKRYNAKKIAIIASESIIYDVDSLQEVMNIEIEVYKIKDEKDVKNALQTAQICDADAIVGGLTACDMAKEIGWQCVQIETGEEAVRRSINEALNAANAARLEREKAELLNVILENAKEAIVALDQEGLITAFNRAAYKTLNIPQNRKVKGQFISELIPDTDLLKAIHAGEEEAGVIKKINDKMVISDYVPIRVDSRNVGLVCTFQNVDKIQEIESKIRKELNRKGLVAKYSFGNIIGSSKVVNKTIQTAYKYSQVDSNILLVGETGTGKELFAQSIHNASGRRMQPFVAVNCAAVPENLLESELFGYVEGAFSGAAKGGKTGLFELAHKGTIFLDEISELSVNLQAKLLRVLQEKEIRRVGDDKVIPVDVRVISASNIDLKEKVKEGQFRQDLLYRLDVLNLKLPPLRDRVEDIMSIIEYYMKRYCQEPGKEIPVFAGDAVKTLNTYAWPGNIRELRNICERLVVLTEGDCVTRQDVMELLGIKDEQQRRENNLSNDSMAETEPTVGNEMEAIFAMMQMAKINKADVAKALGISRTTLWRRLKDKL